MGRKRKIYGSFYCLFEQDDLRCVCFDKGRDSELSIALSHPYIVSVFTFEEVTPVGPGIVMEYIDGYTLTEFLAQNPSRKLRQRAVAQF